MAERQHDPDFASLNGWDGDFETYDDFDLPTYVGPVSFSRLPWVTAVTASPGRAGVEPRRP